MNLKKNPVNKVLVQPLTMSLPLRQLFNGERAVVLLYVFQILFSTPFSLLPQAISIFLLFLLALFVEIFADDASNPLAKSFTTRPGASSGILLGAVTLPGVMLARLILVFRSVPLGQDGTQGLEYMKLQFWASLATCSTVLVFLRILCCQGNGTHFNFSIKRKYSYISITLFGLVLVSSSAMLYDGWRVAFISLWVLSHGLAAIKLIQTIMHMFPACASIGESLLVTSGLVVYIGDMLAITIQKVIPGYFTSSVEVLQEYDIDRSEISTIIQGLTFGLLLFPLLYKVVLQMCRPFLSLSNREMRDHEIRRAFIFYTSLTVMLVVVVPSWMQLVHSFQVHPLLWALQFICSEPRKRIAICTYWLVIIYFSVTRFYDISKNSKTERILLRKYYHLMAVSIFVPALIFQPRFLNLAFGAALAAFLLLEIIRIWKIWPFGHLVHHFMNAFTDHRDSDLLIVSHFSLLLGCAIPIWLSSGFNDRPLAPFAGILSLGIGDTMASMVGHKYGVLRWSKTGKKTIEGTAAGITSVLAACFVLLPLLATTGYIFTMDWFPLVIAVTTSGLLEAYTTQLDNAFIPLVFYSLLCL